MPASGTAGYTVTGDGDLSPTWARLPWRTSREQRGTDRRDTDGGTATGTIVAGSVTATFNTSSMAPGSSVTGLHDHLRRSRRHGEPDQHHHDDDGRRHTDQQRGGRVAGERWRTSA